MLVGSITSDFTFGTSSATRYFVKEFQQDFEAFQHQHLARGLKAITAHFETQWFRAEQFMCELLNICP